MIVRAHKPLIYLTLLGTCLAGMLHTSWLAICVGAGLLMLMSLTWHKVSYARYAGDNDLIAQSALFIFAGVNASIAAAVSFASGMLISWVWGI
jgi:hypothetical protein